MHMPLTTIFKTENEAQNTCIAFTTETLRARYKSTIFLLPLSVKVHFIHLCLTKPCVLPVIIQAPLCVVLAALIRPLLKISLWWGSSLKFLRPPCKDITMSGFFSFHCRIISSSVNSGLVLSARRIYCNNRKTYYMADSLNRQDKLNPTLWLATQADKKVLSCLLGITWCIP